MFISKYWFGLTAQIFLVKVEPSRCINILLHDLRQRTTFILINKLVFLVLIKMHILIILWTKYTYTILKDKTLIRS